MLYVRGDEVAGQRQDNDRRGSGLGVGSNRGVQTSRCRKWEVLPTNQTGEQNGDFQGCRCAGVRCGWGAGCGRAGVGQRSQPAERLGGESTQSSLGPTRDGAMDPRELGPGRSDGVNRASQSRPGKGPYPGRSIAETTAQNGKTKTISTREPLSTPQR